MSRSRALLLLTTLVSLLQAITAAWLRWLSAYLHAPNGLLRPLLMVGMTVGLLSLLLSLGLAREGGGLYAMCKQCRDQAYVRLKEHFLP